MAKKGLTYALAAAGSLLVASQSNANIDRRAAEMPKLELKRGILENQFRLRGVLERLRKDAEELKIETGGDRMDEDSFRLPNNGRMEIPLPPLKNRDTNKDSEPIDDPGAWEIYKQQQLKKMLEQQGPNRCTIG